MEEDYISFLVYDSEGDIIRTGECLESLLLDQAETTEGETVVENPQPGVITDLSHYWDGTAFVEYPPSPGDWAIFDHVNEVWTDPRPVNHDDDFNANDYSFDGEYGYDAVNDRIYWDAGVAIRDNARYSEQQSYSSGYIQWTSGVIYVYYDWDLATFDSAPAISAAYDTPRRILVGEYRGGDQFIDALRQPAIDGARVFSNTVNGRSIETGTIQPFKLNNIDFYNFVANPDFDPNHRDWIETNPSGISRSHLDKSEDAEWDFDKVRFTASGFKTGLVYGAPVRVDGGDIYRLSVYVRGSDYEQFLTVGWSYSYEVVSNPTTLPYVSSGAGQLGTTTSGRVIKFTVNVPQGAKFMYPIVGLQLNSGWVELSRLTVRPLLGAEVLNSLPVPLYYSDSSATATKIISSQSSANATFHVTGILQADANGEINMAYLTRADGQTLLQRTYFSYSGLPPGSIHYERRIFRPLTDSLVQVGFQLSADTGEEVKGEIVRLDVLEVRYQA